jgi:cell division transport system permease protein
VTDAQKAAIEKVLKANPDVASFRLESQQQAYDRIQHLNVPASSFKGPDPAIKVSDMPESYWITMKDPHKAASIKESVQGLDGVSSVQDLHNIMGSILGTIDKLRNGAIVAAVLLVIAALLLVSNTIRLAAFARRREIAIMRLVGASTLYIALPFLLEALVTAVVGVVLAGGAVAAVVYFGVVNGLSKLRWDAWVGWHEFWQASIVIAVLGVALTLLPTLLLTRKYLKV